MQPAPGVVACGWDTSPNVKPSLKVDEFPLYGRFSHPNERPFGASTEGFQCEFMCHMSYVRQMHRMCVKDLTYRGYMLQQLTSTIYAVYTKKERWRPGEINKSHSEGRPLVYTPSVRRTLPFLG